MLVVDACVAVKWFRDEPDTDKANTLLDSGHKLIAPDLIRIEVAATLTRFLRTGEMEDSDVVTLLEDWRDSLITGTISLEAAVNDFEAATEVSCKVRHQLQDCLYVALARRFNTSLITSDKKLLKKADDMPCTMINLSDFKV